MFSPKQAKPTPQRPRHAMRQGDVILIPIAHAPEGYQLSHTTLAEGEVTGHRHRISQGQAELYERNGTLYLKVLSETAILSHEEHRAITIPSGEWMVLIQREYVPSSTPAPTVVIDTHRQDLLVDFLTKLDLAEHQHEQKMQLELRTKPIEKIYPHLRVRRKHPLSLARLRSAMQGLLEGLGSRRAVPRVVQNSSSWRTTQQLRSSHLTSLYRSGESWHNVSD